ncbi:Gfo/Idh/MocA family protein [Hephaestia sp. GCM10023244]|uniref:Gfo/Idh/MocA family protein n=1 Tax=unclassified Hephaestia TaxID=2631281 RepID=UPI00207753AE|nr:Gfo/Idh/MocA family oxidoreductase [Hephaestia sp. MAHUQ-44]MCM8730574.1 Gfo/Idh/MocA family oxidoreductase [Hephaestia sp. MAHUQ-44]
MLRGGLIGCGFFAANQLHAWRDQDGAGIVAICDTDPERLAATGEQFGIAARYTDAEAMFAAENLDFVDIATTPPSHRTLVERAARHGVPVICQKPLAATLADAEAMVAACAAAGVAMMVHENFRWQAPIRALKAVIDEGRIGTPFFARFAFRSGFDVYAAQPYLAEGDRFIIEDLGIHILDVARFVMGEAATLTCRTQRVNPAIRGEDVATILLGHTSGATSVVDCSYATPIHDELFPQTLIEVDGDKGRLRLGADYRLTIEDRTRIEERDVSPPLLAWAERPWHGIQESVAAIQDHWVACLRAGQEPDTSGRDNLRTLALVDAAYRSAASGRTLDVDPR